MRLGFIRSFLFFITLLVVAFFASGLAFAQSPHTKDSHTENPQPRLPVSALTLVTQTGEHQFQVEMALAPDQRRMGLMFRKTMAPHEGMLFDFAADEMVYMWMKNTQLSLDMLFVDSSGQIVTVAEKTKPFSLDTISSRRPVRFVIELSAGTAQKLHIRTGDRIKNIVLGNE